MNRRMTEEQCRLVEENQGLVYFVLQKRFWGVPHDEWEDYVSLGMMGLCYAVMAWEPEKGAFSTLAGRCIEMEVRKYVRYQRQGCRDRRMEAWSVDSEVPGTEGIRFADVIPAPDNTEDRLDEWALRDAIGRLGDRDKKMIDLMLAGKTQSQIGDALGLSQSYVARCLQRIERQLRREVCA